MSAPFTSAEAKISWAKEIVNLTSEHEVYQRVVHVWDNYGPEAAFNYLIGVHQVHDVRELDEDDELFYDFVNGDQVYGDPYGHVLILNRRRGSLLLRWYMPNRD